MVTTETLAESKTMVERPWKTNMIRFFSLREVTEEAEQISLGNSLQIL